MVQSAETFQKSATDFSQPGRRNRLGTGPDPPRRPSAVGRRPQEHLAVAVALQTAPVTVLGLSEDASRALVTLEQAAPAAPRAAMGAVRLTRPHNHGESLAPPIAPSALTAVGTAARHRHVLVIETPRADGSRPAPGEDGFLPVRRVEPYHLVVRAGRWCLVAYDLEDRQWRVLRVGRLRPRPITQCSSPRELAQACRRLVHRWAAIAGTGHAPAPPP